ncbi:MAG: sulfotransferase [Thiohalocapsa sp.]|nr:sulfotransferase [Thiohalocapsa sp.]
MNDFDEEQEAGEAAADGLLLAGRTDWDAVEPGAMDTGAPVFLVGMNGSGTTMLLDSLGRHPDLFGFMRETRLLPHAIRQVRALGDLSDDERFAQAWRLLQRIPAFEVVYGEGPPPIPDNWRQFPRDAGAVADAFFRFFATSAGKTRWCEKSPQNVQHIELLASVFPAAKFVHVIRDGRACAASFHRRWGRNPQMTVYRWKHAVAEGRRQGEALGERYFEVRYEALTSDPDHWMRGICEFLDIAFDPCVLDSRQPQSSQPNQPGKIRANPSSWATYFSPAKLKSLEDLAGGYLAELGYETRYSAGAREPSRLQKRFWRTEELMRLWISLIMRKARGENRYLPWSQVLTRPLASMKQSRVNKV